MASDWHNLGRDMKRLVLSAMAGKRGFQLELCGHSFQVAYESRCLRQDRDYEALFALAQGKNCIIDVGANHGITSLLMATAMRPGGKVYALEASEEACRIAQTNIALNNLLGSVFVINTLVAENPGELLDFYWSYASGGASLIEGYLGHAYPIRKIALSLDAFCSNNSIRPDLVKIDVEGAEARVIQGLHKVMMDVKPIIKVELHNWKEMAVASNAACILEMIKPLDYQMIYLRTQSAIDDPELLSDRGRCHVLLLPSGSETPEALRKVDTRGL